MPNRIWFDTEFIEDGKTIDLISIGLINEDGQTYYAENSECDFDKASDWVKENVFPHLQKGNALRTREKIARDLLVFCPYNPTFISWYCSYDWVVLCQLFGRMVDLPTKAPYNWPMYCNDLEQYAKYLGNPKLPKYDATEHHVLADAKWVKQAWEFLEKYDRNVAHSRPGYFR